MKKLLIPAFAAGSMAFAPIAGCAAPATSPQNPFILTQSLSLVKPVALPQTGVVALRGYGRVAATFAPGRAEFICESADKADRLMGKLLADAFWDAGASHTQKTVQVGKASLTVHEQAGYGALIAARNANRVVVIGAPDEAGALQIAAKEPLFRQAGTLFAPAKAYPIYLDFYDLRALKLYTGAMNEPTAIGQDPHWDFVKKFGLGGLTTQAPNTNFNNPAPGVIQWAPVDYEVRQAAAAGGMIVPSLWMGGEVSLWMHNDYPFSMMQASPSSLLGAWNGTGPAGAHFLSWGLPQPQADATIGQFARQVVNRYKDSPAVGGWHLYAGSPGAEMAFHDRFTGLWDYSRAGQEGFRTWLRTERGLSLGGIGTRWYGDAAHFKSWNEVSVPDVSTFFGDVEHGALRLRDNWKWKKSDPAKTSEQQPDASAPGWVPVAMPPSQQQAFFPWGAAFYRTNFNASDWLQKAGGKDVFLTVDVSTLKDEGTQVWLNGELLGAFKSGRAPGPFAVKVTGKVRAGDNELVLRVPSGRDSATSDGKLFGPVALTTTAPRLYPFLGREANARWVDLREWQAYGMYRSHVLAAQEARAADPDRPFILSGTEGGLGNFNNDLAVRFGMGTQFTGREAYYFPWSARSGIVAGFYGTGEPSATASGTRLDRTVGWMLIDGDSNADLFIDIEDYMRQEKDTGWFSKNQSLLRLFGKTLPETPQIAILHSAQTILMGSDLPMNADIGRGELHAAHYDYGYATERELANGDVNPFPIMFDGGSEIMTEETVKNIESYVRQGGTFIAQAETGRHTLEAPDTYPISRISGFQVAKVDQSGALRFGAGLPLFKGWENREFNGQGVALAPNPAAPGGVALAKWADGSTAVGVRQLGKGRIITLGSSFWRSHDGNESAFFERLFSDLGVERNTQSSDSEIWTRKVITKNGLQNWLLAFNSGGPRTADVSFKVASKPAQVMDLVANQPVEFSYSNDGWVKVAGVQFADQGTRAFGVKRADFTGALPFWWAEKTRYWRQSEGGALPPAMPNTRTVVFDKWKFQTDPNGTAAADWMQPAFNDAKWQEIETGPWNLQDPKLQEYRGAGLYRSKFSLPPAWKGRTVTFNLYAFNTPIVYDKGEFFLNGQKVTDYSAVGGSQTRNYDVTPLLKDGENVLSVKVMGGQKMSGVAGCIWLEPERALGSQLDLGGTWQAVAGDFLTRRDLVLPGGTQAKYLEREVTVPANWANRNVFVHIEAPGGQWMKSVVVNGHEITYNSYMHAFGTRAEINISPYVKFGQANQIQIWPWNTIPIQGYGSEGPEDRFDISKIVVGVEGK